MNKNTENPKENNSNKLNHDQLEEYYNYKYWREIQRNQLGTSANLFFVLTSAIFGFIINLLIKEKINLNCISKTLLITSLIFLLLSLINYIIFTQNRLNDFRITAKEIKKKINNENISYTDISKNSEDIGKKSWNYYKNQRCFLILGFVFSFIGLLIYIFS